MKAIQIPVGHMQNFTYVIYDHDTRHAAIIDPSWDLDRVKASITQQNLQPDCIINTHHHFDHTIGNEVLSRALKVPILQHPLSGLPHNTDIAEGDTVPVGDDTLQVMHTPGHSQDSICLMCGTMLFCGDTLFVGSCGRTDLPGGDAAQLYQSLRRLATLPGDTVIYPGHHYGDATTSTISEQLQTNPVLQPHTMEEFVAMLQ